MMKRFLCALLTVCLLLGIAIVPTMAEEAPRNIESARQSGKKAEYAVRAPLARKGALAKAAPTPLPSDWVWIKNQYVYRDNREETPGGDKEVLYTFQVTEPSIVNLETKFYGYGAVVSLSGTQGLNGKIDSGSSYKKKYSYNKLSAYLDAGEYRVRVYGLDTIDYEQHYAKRVKYDIRMKLTSVKDKLTNPDAVNRSEASARACTLGETYRGMLGLCDKERYFKLELAENAKIRFDFKLYKKPFNICVYRDNMDETITLCWDLFMLNKRTLKKATRYKKDIDLIAGTYYIAVDNLYLDYNPYEDDEPTVQSLSSRNGLFDLTVTNLGGATPKLALPKTFYVTKGFTAPTFVSMNPTWFPVPSDLTYAITSGKSYAAVDAGGMLSGTKLGKAKLAVQRASDPKARATATVQVRANGFSRKKPLYDPNKERLYLSIKRMYFKNNYLYVDIFFYNRTGYTLRYLEDITFHLYDNVANESIPNTEVYIQRIKRAIKMNKYLVVTVKYPAAIAAYANRYDLWNDVLSINLTEYYDPDFTLVRASKRAPAAPARLREAEQAQLQTDKN